MIPIIISKLKFFKVKRKFFFRDPVKLYKSFLGITPKPFQSIDIDLASGKVFSMINLKMPVTTEHKRVIDSEFVCVYDRTAPYLFYSHIKHSFGSYIGKNLHLNKTIPLEDTEYRNLIFGTPATRSFASTTKICLIRFYLAFKKSILSFMGKNSLPYDSSSPKNGRIGYTYLFGYSSCRELQFKELYYPKPIKRTYLKFTNPAASIIRELISTPLTAVSLAWNSIYLLCLATYAEFLMIFPTRFYEKFSCFVFSLYSTVELAY